MTAVADHGRSSSSVQQWMKHVAPMYIILLRLPGQPPLLLRAVVPHFADMVRHAAAKLVPPSYRGAAKKGDKDKKDEKKEDRTYEASRDVPPLQEPARVGSLALGGGKGNDAISHRPSKGPASSGEGGLKMTVPAPKVIPASPSSSSTLDVCGVALVSNRPDKQEAEVEGERV